MNTATERIVTAVVGLGLAAASGVGTNAYNTAQPVDCSVPIERWEEQLNKCQEREISSRDWCLEKLR